MYDEGHKIMLERIEGLTDSTKHHLQESQEIRSHVSGRSSDQSTQLGPLIIWTSVIVTEVKNCNSIHFRLFEKFLFFMLVPYREFVCLMTTSILIVLWC
jgi:hypothetical protein